MFRFRDDGEEFLATPWGYYKLSNTDRAYNRLAEVFLVGLSYANEDDALRAWSVMSPEQLWLSEHMV